MTATAHIYLDIRKSRRTAQGLNPVRLEVIFKGKQRYYSLKDKLKPEWRALDEETYKKAMQRGKYSEKKPQGTNRDIGIKLRAIENEVNYLIAKMPVFSFEKFKQKFFGQASSWDDIFDAFDAYIWELRESRRFGYATSFKSTKTALAKFNRQQSLSFVDVDPKFLERFERYLAEKGKTETTIGVYTRNIRRLFNLATKREGVKADYPFGNPENGLYSPPQGSGRKIALSAHQIGMIANYKAEPGSDEEYYRDLFMFSFLGNGMNVADILRLKYKNIENGSITFIREKTKRKNKGQKIEVEITPRMQEIIDKWGQRVIAPEVFVFKALNENMSWEEKYRKIRRENYKLNAYLKEIAKELKIEENVSSYTARHSFATITKNAGVPIAYLKEALGHSDVSVTENYLAGLERDEKRKIATDLEQKIYGNNLRIS
jgi:site-specific recombinase XerD